MASPKIELEAQGERQGIEADLVHLVRVDFAYGPLAAAPPPGFDEAYFARVQGSSRKANPTPRRCGGQIGPRHCACSLPPSRRPEMVKLNSEADEA